MKNPTGKQTKLSTGSGRRYYSTERIQLDDRNIPLPGVSVTDEALIIKFLNGDTAAFNTLAQRWQKPIYNFVLRSGQCERSDPADVYPRLPGAAQAGQPDSVLELAVSDCVERS